MPSEDDTTYYPSAFPNDGTFEPGLSIRDYFAATALAGMMTRHTAGLIRDAGGALFEAYAKDAYAVADSMMKERDKK